MMVIDSVCDSAVSAHIMKYDEYSTKNPSSNVSTLLSTQETIDALTIILNFLLTAGPKEIVLVLNYFQTIV